MGKILKVGSNTDIPSKGGFVSDSGISGLAAKEDHKHPWWDKDWDLVPMGSGWTTVGGTYQNLSISRAGSLRLLSAGLKNATVNATLGTLAPIDRPIYAQFHPFHISGAGGAGMHYAYIDPATGVITVYKADLTLLNYTVTFAYLTDILYRVDK